MTFTRKGVTIGALAIGAVVAGVVAAEAVYYTVTSCKFIFHDGQWLLACKPLSGTLPLDFLK